MVVCQAPLSAGFPRQEYWSGLSFPSPGDLPDPGLEPESSALAGRFVTAEPTQKPYIIFHIIIYISVHKFWIFSRLKLQTSLFFSFRVPRFRGLPFLPTSFLLSFLLWGVLWGCRLQSSHVSKTPPLKGQGPCCWRSLFFWV